MDTLKKELQLSIFDYHHPQQAAPESPLFWSTCYIALQTFFYTRTYVGAHRSRDNIILVCFVILEKHK